MKRSTVFVASALALMVATPVVAQDWNGFYAGVSASSGTFGLSGPALGGFEFTGSDTSPGVFIGYNHALQNNWVVGGELSYSAVDSWIGLPGDVAEMDGLAMLRGRVGYANGQVMPYIAAGVASSEFGVPTSGISAQSETGYNVGIGVEYLFSNNMSLRAEYSITEFDDILSPPAPPNGVDASYEAITVGVAWHF